MCWKVANRLIFYESVRVKFSQLKQLGVPRKSESANQLYEHFQKVFQLAIEATGDYETVFYPFDKDWAGSLIFGHADATDAWRSVLANLEPFNFKEIRTDILGGIFKRLIAPEERHKFGQHYTSEDLVDVVNAFCIRKASDTILDPACGSGSFLVRAYHRKAWMRPGDHHQERISQLYGTDIGLFAAHLSTLNLAARDVQEEENYPRIARRNFFEIAADKPFCNLPTGLRDERKIEPIYLSKLNAIVGNPPYVRQELIPKRGEKGIKLMQAKEDLQDLVSRLWPGLKLTGRSDLHCYFWPAATALLEKEGWFGFLVSSSWLDVEYGFALQEWALQNFKIHAILESTAEPWFEDARVKTCAIIMQRCSDEKERNDNLVKFVRLKIPLAKLLGDRNDENARQTASENFRDLIVRAKGNKVTDDYRIVVRKQRELWAEGLRAGRLFEMQRMRDAGASAGEDDEYHEESDDVGDLSAISATGYGGGKWGKYLRAPDLYFRIMERFGNKFVPLGEIATIRFGVKSGCDAFFMPWDVTSKILEKYGERNWKDAPLHTHCKRGELTTGSVKLIEDGAGVVHPIESKYLAPEVHSLMNVQRPVITAAELDRLVLLVSAPLSELKGTYVQKYLRYGEKTAFSSKKSKAVPVPQRATCSARDRWYDLTYTKSGHLVWPKSQQYRHVIIHNRHNLIVNCNLYDVTITDATSIAPDLLAAVLNSTLVGLVKTYFGRYAGTEGNLKTEVVDVNLLEIPVPRKISPGVARKMRDAFEKLCQRDTRPLVEEELMKCRSSERAKKIADGPLELPVELTLPDRRALDLAVFEMLGVNDEAEQLKLCDELYRETAMHFRHIRAVEIQKQEQRAGTEGGEFRTDELAADLWDGLEEDEKKPIYEWLRNRVSDGFSVKVPEGEARLPDAADMLDANTVFFKPSGHAKGVLPRLELPSRAHAELIASLASQKVHGLVILPENPAAAQRVLNELVARIDNIGTRSHQLAASRTSDHKKVDDLANLLRSWMLSGK